MSSVALISSGEHTFTVERCITQHDDGPLEIYTLTVPPEEGSIRLARRGLHNDGPFGVEFEFDSRTALSTDRGMWWAHALHAITCLAQELNVRAQRLV
ncbi:hypothetical protein D1781_16250 [Amnibacterium setariae]|uniref:Uncharacterized protein n=2 Tax=Amnibacterium setariae TaxID=2306585 RepID=A0A3A1TS20_9MICO|nr:hypothetical protein D1781_16250 [Amnibacterium setariae]